MTKGQTQRRTSRAMGVTLRLVLGCAVSGVALAFVAGQAMACSYAYEDRSAAQIRADSGRAAQDQTCRMINGGVNDNLRLSRATPLGDGRVMQVVNDDPTLVLLADCNTREATMLRGPATLQGETSCGPHYDYAALTGADAVMSLSQGADLHALVATATSQGATEINPLTYFFEFTAFGLEGSHAVGRQDRFNILCGCDVHYPESPGASQ